MKTDTFTGLPPDIEGIRVDIGEILFIKGSAFRVGSVGRKAMVLHAMPGHWIVTPRELRRLEREARKAKEPIV